MASTYKVLGQSSPSAATNTDLYTVPSATQAVGSTLSICNRGPSPTTVNVAVRPAGAAIANQHYIMYGVTVPANDSLYLTIGIALSTTDVVTVYSTLATVSFSLFGSEIS